MNIIFEDTGLLVGLISYPYNVKGANFFNEEFKKNLFCKYKKGTANSLELNESEIYKSSPIYEPKGYHLFGDYNMAVLSLIDGYALGNRVFHPGHGYHGSSEESNESKNYNYQLITGITYEEKETGPCNYLRDKAKKTFLKADNRYPFIGITRFKLNNGLLIGCGISLTSAIRKVVNEKLENNLEAFTIDCFGNNELTMLTFSDSLVKISDFINAIRSLKVSELVDFDSSPSLLEQLKRCVSRDAHIFSTSYTNLGYDLDYKEEYIREPEKTFIKPKTDPNLLFNIRWEIKPGHESQFKDVLSKICKLYESRESDLVRQSLLGGNSFYVPAVFELDKHIHFMKLVCPSKKTKRHVRKLRMQFFKQHANEQKPLLDDEDLKNELEGEDIHTDFPKLPDLGFTIGYMNKLRANLHRCGTSKLTKERLMKMYARFNDSIRDKSFYIYFIELRGFLQGIGEAIDQYAQNPEIEIKHIEKYLSKAIEVFEGAYNNRFHQSAKMGNLADTNLEYNGGIQQYVTSFDFIFKQAVKSIVSKNDEKKWLNSFAYISGFENVISTKETVRINMNLITYPELFAVSIFKEACNFIPKRERYGNVISDTPIVGEYVKGMKEWEENILNNKIRAYLYSVLTDSTLYNPNNYNYQAIEKALGNELLEYFVADIYNLYFGFNGDLPLMEYFYWKYFMQMAQFYNRDGEICRSVFVFFLLRILILKFYEADDSCPTDEICKKIKSQQFSFFDPQLASLWLSHFRDIADIAAILWNGLKREHFKKHVDSTICYKISRRIGQEYATYKAIEVLVVKQNSQAEFSIPNWIALKSDKEASKCAQTMYKEVNVKDLDEGLGREKKEKEIFQFYKECRGNEIKRMIESFKRKELIISQEAPIPDRYFLFNMLTAYLYTIKECDGDKTRKVLLRDAEGKVVNTFKDASALLSDPFGGFFTHGMQARKDYFVYRTVLYKSMWNYVMKIKVDLIVANGKKE